jgi:hypothetical protein
LANAFIYANWGLERSYNGQLSYLALKL